MRRDEYEAREKESIKILKKKGGVTAAEFAEEMGFTKPAAYRHIEHVENKYQGHVMKTKRRQGKKGPLATVYYFA
jgi:predicted ArsR family transcriptional regulator